MITFNVQAPNGNYYRGHAPSNDHGNCWTSKSSNALVFTLDQARKLVKTWGHYLKIVISVESKPMSKKAFQRELFCAKGGDWYEYKEEIQ